jgi:hypothetical protein
MKIGIQFKVGLAYDIKFVSTEVLRNTLYILPAKNVPVLKREKSS